MKFAHMTSPALMRRFLCLLTVLVWPGLAMAAKSVQCTDPATGDKKAVSVRSVRSGLDRVRRALKKYGIHILDLPQAVQERHSYLPQFLAEKNWCVLNSHVIAIEDALGMMQINQGFIADKFARIERWMRTGIEDPVEKTKAERWLANAAAQMADRRFEDANRLLNKVMGLMFGTSDTWRLPEKLPVPEEATGSSVTAPPIKTKEVEAGCPLLAKRGGATPEDLKSTLAKLHRLMDKRTLRPMDLKGGEQLVGDLNSYVKLSATWPAARIACALVDRTRSIEIDLGVVQKRFQRAKNLKEQRGLADGSEQRFKELVRAASDKMMARDFDQAHQDLEALLVLIGEPSRPSAALP
jgi:hypothetical protein